MDEAGRNKLWENYGKTKSPEIREKLILEYAPLVKLVAGRLSVTARQGNRPQIFPGSRQSPHL